MHNALWLLLVPKQPSFSWEAKQHQVYLNSNTQQIQQMQHLHHKHNWKLYQHILQGLQAPHGTGIQPDE